MIARRGNLQPAHRGYLYQDISVAYMLVRAVVERYDEVIVDRKQVEDDRIDDFEIVVAGKRARRQFKSSDNPQRKIASTDFTATESSVRIDRLVLTYVRAAEAAAEYRLCATWQTPDLADPLVELLEPINSEPTIRGYLSKCYRFRGERLWPADGDPVWAPLMQFRQPRAEFGREDLIAFCQRFVIELSLPPTSNSLRAPGPLERALVEELAQRVGIGRYPNHGRTAGDVAALVVSLATLTRGQGGSLSPADIERELAIRTDFGRVAQAFPLDEALFHDRPEFRKILGDAAIAGTRQILLGPPGAGKSWELTRLGDELDAAGAIVARHYCYLEPGDELVVRRVTVDVFFGNLLTDLIDAAPELRGASEARYAAGFSELEATLTRAATLERPVVLIIDGLDHILRIRADSRLLSSDETDIMEHLATLAIPSTVGVIIGSQPGGHLDPLRARWGALVTERQLPPWQPADVVALARRYGIARTLDAVAITDTDDIDHVLNTLANRADGNPLYARYLARGLIAGLQDGSIANPQDWLIGAPAIAGDIAVYYAHLYRTASREGHVIADILGAIDFAVTESELGEILPPFVSAFVPAALAQLAPVLTTSRGQGGIRIFHESFRRFMTEQLAMQGRSLAATLTPVIEWLNRRGFFRDAKSYRFLLPALRRADRDAEVLERVGVAFVSTSAAHAHPLQAIQRNLALAADIAGRRRDWPTLIRCVELHRSADIFYELQNSWAEYSVTFMQLFGHEALAERLLFDGRPTQNRDEGLLACALIDRAGGIAPWREYLDLPDTEESDSGSSLADSSDMTKPEQVIVATIHGLLRLGNRVSVIRWLYEYLGERPDDLKIVFVRAIASTIARYLGPSFVGLIANRANRRTRGRASISNRAAAALLLGVADEYSRRGNGSEARLAATRALENAKIPELAVACLALGAAAETAALSAVDPSTVSIAVGPGEHLHDAFGVLSWIASIRLIANGSVYAENVLNSERQRVAGVGWYRCWLRYVLSVASTERARRSKDNGDIARAFQELTRDVHPFRGTPRACDLYSIRTIIGDSIAWGLSLVRTERDWHQTLQALTVAARETRSSLDREDGGPLPTGMLLELLLPHVNHPAGGHLVRDVIEQEIAHRNHFGTYYPTHAEYMMRLARARSAVGDIASANEAWAQAAVYRTAHGWHKDHTVFEVIESAPALLRTSTESALRALRDTQPLTNAVIAHTDHRETRHAPNAWFQSLIAVSAPLAIALLARTISEKDGAVGWPIERAIRDVVAQVIESADPALLDAVLSTLRFDIDHESEAADVAKARLAPAIRLARRDRALAAHAFRQIAAEVSNDARRNVHLAAPIVSAATAELGFHVPRMSRPNESDSNISSRSAAEIRLNELELSWAYEPPFPPRPSLVDLMAGLRAVGEQFQWDDQKGWDRVVLPLSYYISQIIDDGRYEDARRLVRFFARDVRVAPSGAAHPLAKLAKALDNAGYEEIAAVAYALAYTATRGSGGWFRLGDRKHKNLVARAFTLEPTATLQVIADEIAYILRGASYTMGTSRHLIDRISEWGEPTVTESTWREAFAVISHRLPLAPGSGSFSQLDLDDSPTWTVDEGLVALLLAQLGEPRLRLKICALSGLGHAIQRRPDAVVKALQWWLTRNAHVTSVLLALDTWWNCEAEPYLVTHSLVDILNGYAVGEIWGARQWASMLLRRAGLDVPAAQQVEALSIELRSADFLSAERQKAILDADVNHSLDVLGPVWPDLPRLVARRLNKIVTAVQRDRCSARYRLAYGRDRDAIPPTPVLLWEWELFVTVLHEQLNGLSSRLWLTGSWTPNYERELLADIVPDTAVHLGLAASRTVRPVWPDPASASTGTGSLPTVGDDDPLFVRWTRLAIVESQFVHDPERRYGPPTECVRLFAGAIAVPIGDVVPSGAFPFEDAEAHDWWQPLTTPPVIPPRLQPGCLVRLGRKTDWLGDDHILVPPFELRTYLDLQPPGYRAPLVWSDRNGAPAIVLRSWRVRNAEAFDSEPADYEGVDLIARPDVVERLGTLCAMPLRELRVIDRRPIHQE